MIVWAIARSDFKFGFTIYGMNAKLKCKQNNQMTVTSHSPNTSSTSSVANPRLIPNHNFCPNYSKQLLSKTSDRLNAGLLSHKSLRSVLPAELRSGHCYDRTDPSSSLILRQKLLYRNKNGSVVGTAHTSKSGRKSYNRSQNNGFKFHNFVVNEDKQSCLEEQDGTKKITVSHWKRSSNPQVIVNEDLHESSPEPIAAASPPSQSILETLLAPTSSISQPEVTEDQQRISKRKPLHVRRVLRQHDKHMMDLSQAQPQEEPLDLSFKRIDFNSLKFESNDSNMDFERNDRFICESPTESVQHLIKSVNRSAAQASAIISSVKCPINGNHLPNSSHFDSSVAQRQIAMNSGVSSAKQQKLRQTQRSLIKKQLEETFKQNGFLVKVCIVSFSFHC